VGYQSYELAVHALNLIAILNFLKGILVYRFTILEDTIAIMYFDQT